MGSCMVLFFTVEERYVPTSPFSTLGMKGGENMTGNRKASLTVDGERTDHYIYLAAIRAAKLLAKEKLLLLFYANAHNWKEERCSNYGEERICSIVSMSPKTFRKTRSRLVELGWIVVHENGYRQTPDIELRFGNDDALYETKEWAKWWQPEGKRRNRYGNPVRPEDNQEENQTGRENEPF